MVAKIGSLGLHRASGKWFVRVDGKMKYLTKPRATENDAQIALAKLRLELCCPEPSDTSPDDMPIKKLAEEYIFDMMNAGDTKHKRDQKRYIDRYCEAFGDKTLKSISPLGCDHGFGQ